MRTLIIDSIIALKASMQIRILSPTPNHSFYSRPPKIRYLQPSRRTITYYPDSNFMPTPSVQRSRRMSFQ